MAPLLPRPTAPTLKRETGVNAYFWARGIKLVMRVSMVNPVFSRRVLTSSAGIAASKESAFDARYSMTMPRAFSLSLKIGDLRSASLAEIFSS